MSKNNWNVDQIAGQTGRVIIVTGSNSGIGFEAAKVLAEKGAQVILAVRDLKKGAAAKAQMLSAYPDARVELMELDLASLDSVKKFTTEFLATYDHLDLLINNAGIMIPPYGKTEDGFESQMGTNHLGHFALTAQLFPLLAKTEKSRIVNVSSMAHNAGNINFDDIHWEQRNYQAWRAYGDSKIANLYFTYELDRRLKQAGINVMTTAAHPGWAATGLQKSWWLKFLNKIMAQSQVMGALPTLMAATDANASGGEFYGPSGFGQQRGFPKQVISNALSQDLEKAAKLWDISEELTHQPFTL